MEAIAYEASVFDFEHENWPDFRRWPNEVHCESLKKSIYRDEGHLPGLIISRRL